MTVLYEIKPRFQGWPRGNVRVQGRSENSHYFGLFNIILSQISPEIISIIRDASQLSGIMTKPSRIRFFFEKWLFLVKLHPIKKISCYLLIWPEVRKWSIFEFHCDRLPHIESSNGIDVYQNYPHTFKITNDYYLKLWFGCSVPNSVIYGYMS